MHIQLSYNILLKYSLVSVFEKETSFIYFIFRWQRVLKSILNNKETDGAPKLVKPAKNLHEEKTNEMHVNYILLG